MDNTKTSDIQIFESLRNALVFFDDETNVVYKSKFVDKNTGFVFTSTDDLLNSLHEFGLQGKTLKEAGFELEEWYELLKQQQETVTEAPRPTGPDATTLTSDQIANFEKDVERQKKSEQIRADQGKVVQQTQDRLKEIYDQQRIIQEQIKKVQELQHEFAGKKVYATEKQQVLVVNPEAQESFETLNEYASYQETRTDLIDQLAEKIQAKTETEEIVARTIAVQLANDISSPELAKEKVREIAIEEAIEEDKDKVLEQILQKDEILIETAKKGALLEAENIKGSVFLTREVAENILPINVVEQIYGPKQIKVGLSSEPSEQTTHEVDLEKSIKNYEINLKEQNKFLDSAREGGADGAKNIFRNQLYSNVNTYLAKSPKGSVLGKVYSSDAVKAILTQGSPNAFELKYFGKNPLLQTYFKYSPESMPYFKLFTEVTGVSVGVGVTSKIIPLTYGRGAIPLAKIAFIQPVKSLGVPYTLGVKTGAKFAVGKATGKIATEVAVKTGLKAGLATTISTTLAAAGLSIPIPVVNFIAAAIGWVAGSIIGEGLSNLWSKFKVWWTKNKDAVGPAVAVVFGFGGLMLGGPAVGGIVLLGGLAATGTLGAFAFGVFNLFGFIGRQVGITIATPVIVTLLVLPPLVAFIMLVINNSAYVVPPDARSLGLNLDNPYVLVTKVASPDKFANPTTNKVTVTYTVTIKALKSPLTKLSITDATCKVSKKNASTVLDCPSELENIPPLPADLTVSPTNPYSFTFTSEFDSTYADSSVFDTIKIKATAEDKEIETSGSESVCIGDCPHGCFEVSDDNEAWPEFKSKLEGATQRLTTEFPGFVDEACNGRPSVKLCYTTSNPTPNGTSGLCNGAIYAIASEVSDNEDRCVINFNQCVFANDRTDNDVFFLLTHEISHHIAWRDEGNMISRYENLGADAELPLCTYSGTTNSEEGSAEANAIYANNGVASFSTCGGPINFQSQYPNNYSYAQSYMNNP